MHEGLSAHDAGIVDQELRREVVDAVDNEVIAGNEVGDVRGVDELAIRHDMHAGIDIVQGLCRTFHLGLADIGEGSRGSEAAGADDQDLRGAELLLALDADLLQDDVAGIALELVRRECHVSGLRP